jgi:hypothetical protein
MSSPAVVDQNPPFAIRGGPRAVASAALDLFKFHGGFFSLALNFVFRLVIPLARVARA